jgi:recombination protein RecA
MNIMSEKDKVNNKIDDRNERLEAVRAALKQIKSTFGEGSVMSFGENRTNEKVKSISTGSLGLDIALGIGGVPKGRIVEIYGHEGSGKTTIALHIIASAQKKGGICAFIDAEHALDVKYAEKIGVQLNDLLISQPENGEQALEISDTLIRSGAIDVIVIDSVAALVPKNELEGEMGDSAMGAQARLMSQALRKLTGSISKHGALVIFINQIRSKIGVVFGNPETTTGGYALKFYASVRLEVKKKGIIKKNDEAVGHELEIKIVKNKFAPPFKSVFFEIIYGEGINNIAELVDICVDKGILQKSGNWFSYGDKKIGNGKDATVKLLKEDKPLIEELKEKLFKIINI